MDHVCWPSASSGIQILMQLQEQSKKLMYLSAALLMLPTCRGFQICAHQNGRTLHSTAQVLCSALSPDVGQSILLLKHQGDGNCCIALCVKTKEESGLFFA